VECTVEELRQFLKDMPGNHIMHLFLDRKSGEMGIYVSTSPLVIDHES